MLPRKAFKCFMAYSFQTGPLSEVPVNARGRKFNEDAQGINNGYTACL